MERKKLKANWSELRDHISEWWSDLTNEDLDRIEGNLEQLIMVLQERYRFTRNLAWKEVQKYMASYNPARRGMQNRSDHHFGNSQYSSPDNDDWFETNNRGGLSSSRQ